MPLTIPLLEDMSENIPEQHPRPAPAPVPQHPSRPLHGPRFNPVQASRRTVAVLLGTTVVGLCAMFISWYTYTVMSLEKHTDQATAKRTGKIKAVTTGTFLRQDIQAKQHPQPLAQSPIAAAPPPGWPNSPKPAPQPTQSVQIAQAPPPPVVEQVPPSPTPASTEPAPQLDPTAEKKANSKLYMAKKREQEGKVRLANKLYLEIIQQYPGTEAARVADQRATKTGDTRNDNAEHELVHAQQLERLDALTEAKAEYAGIASRYPDTEAGKRAKERLAFLNKK